MEKKLFSSKSYFKYENKSFKENKALNNIKYLMNFKSSNIAYLKGTRDYIDI